MSVLPFQNQALGVSPEQINQYWEQFQLTGFPNGTVDGCMPVIGVRYVLSSAQLLALQTTAVLLVAPPITTGLGNLVPPAGYAFIPTSLRAEYKFVTTAYTIGNADNFLRIEYVGKTTTLLSILATGLLDQTASTVTLTPATPTANLQVAVTNCANLGLEVKLAGTSPALTLGDGTLHLALGYTIIPLA